MAAAEYVEEIDAAKVVSTMTLKVRVVKGKRTAFRLWLAGRLAALVAFVAGMDFEFDIVAPGA
jgi:hypothetical protein